MQQANWMSLGIIVTLFACMVHRLASSMRGTKNASAASCKHIMVLPWKHKLVLPKAWAISWTSGEKGSFRIRSSVLFWNCQISQRATVPGQYFLGFFTFPTVRNSFWGALPPMVGWSFLAAGSSPEADGPASTAIWANCWVGDDDRDQPTSSSCLASLNPPLSLFHHLLHLPHGQGLSGWGGVVYRRGGLPSLLWNPSVLLRCSEHSSSLPLLLRCYLSSHHTIKRSKKETVTNWKKL